MNRYLINIAAPAALGLTLALAACSGSDSAHWTLSGSATLNAPAGTLYVDAPAAGGQWRTVDSVAINPGHDFKLDLPRVPHTTIFRLRSAAGVTYAPVDSNEAITFLPATLQVGGTEQAALFSTVDSLIRADFAAGNLTAEADSVLKHKLMAALSGHYGSEAAYYVVKKNVGGKPLLSPLASTQDFKLLRAVTNSFHCFRADDPRTAPLVEEFTRIDATRRTASGIQPTTGVVYAPEISYYDITLTDWNGTRRSLSEAVEANKLVILSFINFTDPEAAIFNMKLGEIYTAHHADGVEVYQVGFDDNQHSWSAVARNLPWISVYQADGASQAHLQQYMVSSLPTVFIIANGEVSERVTTMDRLAASVTKNLK